MAYNDLRQWIAALERAGELRRIQTEVDPILEITEFADRSVKNGGPAMLFEKPKGYQIPVLINSLASMRRMEIAMQVDSVDEIAGRIVEYLEMKMPEGLMGKLKMLPKLAEMGSFFPKIVNRAPCQEVVRTEGFSLFDYPVLKCWPEDGGRYITLPMVFSRNPENGKRNCGMYRIQIYDERTAGMHWQTHKQGAEHYRRMAAEGKKTRMEVAVAIGSHHGHQHHIPRPVGHRSSYRCSRNSTGADHDAGHLMGKQLHRRHGTIGFHERHNHYLVQFHKCADYMSGVDLVRQRQIHMDAGGIHHFGQRQHCRRNGGRCVSTTLHRHGSPYGAQLGTQGALVHQ